MNTVLVTGANGQLGNALRRLAPYQTPYQFLFTDVDTLDITDPQAIGTLVKAHGVDFILNCAAYTAVDKAEDNEPLCRLLNETAVCHLGRAAHEAGARLIHISTDYVFSGHHFTPYTEEDAPDPCSAYGRTKRAGEEALLAVCPEAVIIRTAWLYSEFGHNFVKTVLRLGQEERPLGFVFDQVGTPTYAGDLAAAMLTVMDAARQGHFLPGIYHYTNEGVCSWYDFAVAVLRLSGIDKPVRPIRSCEYPTRAIRPPYSVLDKKKIKTAYGLTIPHWEESLRHCLEQLRAE